jgi:hypothetical protein
MIAASACFRCSREQGPALDEGKPAEILDEA